MWKTLLLKFWKYARYIKNKGFNKCRYCFANISATKAWIVMKFYVVVTYYLVSLPVKFHKDSCINARTGAVNARAHVLSRLRAFTTFARAFVHGFLWNLKTKAHKIVIDHHIKFHKDPSFCCGDICKTILTFWIL